MLLSILLCTLLLSCAPQKQASAVAPQPSPKIIDRDEHVRAMHWSFEELDRPVSTVEHQFEAPLQAALKGAHFSAPYACLARELAEFSARYRALPDEVLSRLIVGRCGGSDVFFYKSQATLFDTGADFSVPFSPEFVREVVGDLFPPGSKLLDATEFGFAVHAEPGGAVALVAFNKPAAFDVVTHAPDAQGIVQVLGEFRTSPHESSALINQGATGTAWCKPIEVLKTPRFGFECPMLPGDSEAWIAISGGAEGDVYHTVHVTALAMRPGAEHAEYRKPYVVLPAGPSDQALIQAINTLRAQAGSKPLRFSEAESQLVRKLQKQAVAGQLAFDDDIDEQIERELLAGRAISEPIFWAEESLGVAAHGDAGDWLAARLLEPGGRRVMMNPDADLVALAGYTDPQMGFGASIVTYGLVMSAGTAIRGQTVKSARRG